MSLLLSMLAEVVQALVMLGGALWLDGLRGWLTARLAGRAAPSVLARWHDLRRLIRKQPMRGETMAMTAAVMPVLALAANAGAAVLVPGFTADLALLPAGDAFVVVGLLVLGRMAMETASGTAAEGIWGDAALLIAAGATAVPGSDVAAAVLAAGAMVLVAEAGVRGEDLRGWPEMSGVDAALLGLAAALRRMVLVALAVGPIMGPGAGGPGIEGWPVSLLVWLAAVSLVTLGVTLAGLAPRRPARMREARMLALALAGVAVVVALATGEGS